jgi:hypothetical protein
MKNEIRLHEVVALTVDVPEKKLHSGQVGTVVEILAPEAFEVEFSDNEGRAYAFAALRSHQLLVLSYEPSETV